eukprot:1092038-Alexandrium_andersonii.AAC.1
MASRVHVRMVPSSVAHRAAELRATSSPARFGRTAWQGISTHTRRHSKLFPATSTHMVPTAMPQR